MPLNTAHAFRTAAILFGTAVLSSALNTPAVVATTNEVQAIDAATGAVRSASSRQAYEQLLDRERRCLAVPSASTADGVGTVLESCGTSADHHQHWQMRDLGNGYYRIIARHSGKCLTVPSSSTANNVRVTQRTCGTGTNQQWRFSPLFSGYYEIMPRHTGKCLTPRYDPAEERPVAVQNLCADVSYQQWVRRIAPS
ncbi:RICIN domain-containing protein [Nonomuraea sp. NPDC049400]|uniref:RICIN domain-containing protein n=1 Tax=Nonomuraea sp. NPDC049400 TaxID=3364352 RepID=UPI0037AA67AF